MSNKNTYYTLKDLLSEFEMAIDYLNLLDFDNEVNSSNRENAIKNITKSINYIKGILNKTNISFYAELKSSITYINLAKSHINLLYDLTDRNKKFIQSAVNHLDNIKQEIEGIIHHTSD